MKQKFSELCYELLKKIPEGRVTSYGEIARVLGTKAYRAVGNAMNKNPHSPIVPCHKVVRSDGKIGGFSRGIKKKIMLLRAEGVEIKNRRIDMAKCLYKLR